MVYWPGQRRCSQVVRTCKKAPSHFKSSWVSLDRKVTLYTAEGKVVQSWQGRSKVGVDDSTARFIKNGKALTTPVTFVIEEQ